MAECMEDADVSNMNGIARLVCCFEHPHTGLHYDEFDGIWWTKHLNTEEPRG